jgi:hypothetical protein
MTNLQCIPQSGRNEKERERERNVYQPHGNISTIQHYKEKHPKTVTSFVLGDLLNFI